MVQNCILVFVATLFTKLNAQPMSDVTSTISPWPKLECPEGTIQIGSLNADIAGCGLEGCDKRYQNKYKTIEECKTGCNLHNKCVSFTWAPLNGDQNHPGKTVCTLYDNREPNRQWAPQQIMCTSPIPRLPAEVTLHCDNIGTLEISYDYGETFTVIAVESDWTIPIYASIQEATEDTILRLTCEDQGVVGGFIATVKYNGINYSTTELISDGYWKLISASDDNTNSLIYSPKGSDPWYIHTESIEEDAVWIWNDDTYNTMVFEFDFKDAILEERSYDKYSEQQITDTTCDDLKYSVPLKWVLILGVMLMVSVLINIYMCYTTRRKATFGHVPVTNCDEVEGKPTDVVSA